MKAAECMSGRGKNEIKYVCCKERKRGEIGRERREKMKWRKSDSER